MGRLVYFLGRYNFGLRSFAFNRGCFSGGIYRGIVFFRYSIVNLSEAVQSEIIDPLKKSIIDRDMVATGALLNSIRFETKELLGRTEIIIYALDYIEDLNFGIRPERQPFPEIRDLIIWIEAKGLNLNPYAVRNSIISKGTFAFQIGGTDIVTDAINAEKFNRVVELASTEIKQKIIKQWQLLFPNNP